MTKTDKTKEANDMPHWKAEGYQSQAHYDKWNAPLSPSNNIITQKIASGEWEKLDIDVSAIDRD
ncbi:hypothetical protein BBC0244_022910 [Bartonella apihabitans]|uniref:hypothetical protein n=1 Tax=Bartonella apihabitans TaxID=2750929 RepID=UPI00098F32A1|nr:hypothetical protein [Bartonella apihabitans]AQT44819.1 hypothetical protein BBC0244_011120 [Bartonella apihabitans]AQT45943.1 hypothetical protein BBC0244_022910 [Bartonella apihabitans]